MPSSKKKTSTAGGRLAIGRLIQRGAIGIVVLALLVAILGGYAATRFLQLDADTNNLIADDRPFMAPFRAWIEEFGDLEFIYVVVDPADASDAEADRVVDLLVDRLREIPELPEVQGWVTADEQWRLGTWSMSEADLEGLVRTGDATGLLASETSNAAILAEGMRRLGRVSDIRALDLDDAARIENAAGGVLLLESIAATRLEDVAELATPSDFELARSRKREYLVNPDGRLRFIEIMPRKDFGTLAAIEGPLAAIREVLSDVGRSHPEVDIGLTGKPVLQADELATSDADMTRCAAAAFTIIAILFIWMFRGIVRPLLIVIAFACAFGWTYGAATLLVGRLNLLSIVFMLVLVGVGLDYGVHIVSRWLESRRAGTSRENTLDEVVRTAGVGNLFGATTSAGVFLLALLTDFGGLRELGLIAGVGLILCMISMCVVLPSLLYLSDRRREVSKVGIDGSTAERYGGDNTSRGAGWVLVVGALATGLFAFAVYEEARFEDNLLELQAEGLESVEWEHRVLEDSSSASWFAASIADSIAQVETITERARTEPAIGEVRSVLDLIAPPTPARDRLRATFASNAMPVEPSGVRSPAAKIDAASLRRASDRVRTLARNARSVDPSGAIRLDALASRLRALSEAFRTAPPQHGGIAARRAAVEATRARVRHAIEMLRSGAEMTLREVLPDAVRKRLMAGSGRFLVSLVPAGDVWNPEGMANFVDAVRRVDPDVTGVPITQYESLRDMRRSFITMGLLALVLVTILVWADFRSIRATLVTMIALLVGLVWTVGIAALVGVSFNVANFFAIPILLGLGVDSGIHLMHRLRETSGASISGTAKAVVITAITTGIGFGSLVFANHRGLQSLGALMAIGSLCCLASTLVLLPSLARRLRACGDDVPCVGESA